MTDGASLPGYSGLLFSLTQTQNLAERLDDLRIGQQDVPELRFAQHEQLGVFDGSDRSRSSGPSQERHLPEALTSTEHRDRLRFILRLAYPDPRPPAGDEKETISLVALPDNGAPGLVQERAKGVGHLSQRIRCQRLEEVYLPEKGEALGEILGGDRPLGLLRNGVHVDRSYRERDFDGVSLESIPDVGHDRAHDDSVSFKIVDPVMDPILDGGVTVFDDSSKGRRLLDHTLYALDGLQENGGDRVRRMPVVHADVKLLPVDRIGLRHVDDLLFRHDAIRHDEVVILFEDLDLHGAPAHLHHLAHMLSHPDPFPWREGPLGRNRDAGKEVRKRLLK